MIEPQEDNPKKFKIQIPLGIRLGTFRIATDSIKSKGLISRVPEDPTNVSDLDFNSSWYVLPTHTHLDSQLQRVAEILKLTFIR